MVPVTKPTGIGTIVIATTGQIGQTGIRALTVTAGVKHNAIHAVTGLTTTTTVAATFVPAHVITIVTGITTE